MAGGAAMAMARLTAAAALISMTAGMLNCPTEKGWRAENDNCYFWDASLLDTWQKAQKFCRAYQGTELLYLENVDEKIWLSTVLDGIYWIGLNDRTQESDFQWTINKPLLADIKLFLRDDIVNGSLKDCVELHTVSGLLKDAVCSKKNKFICKTKKSTVYSSGSVGPLFESNDAPMPSCDCTGLTETSLTSVCGVLVRSCQVACENRRDGTDCSKCLPECPDEPSEAVQEEEVSIVRLAKARSFAGSMLLTNNDRIYLEEFIMFYNDI